MTDNQTPADQEPTIEQMSGLIANWNQPLPDLLEAATLTYEEYEDALQEGIDKSGTGISMGRTMCLISRDKALAAAFEAFEPVVEVLKTIRRDYGQVCENYELCNHAACNSSCAAWLLSDQALTAYEAMKKEAQDAN